MRKTGWAKAGALGIMLLLLAAPRTLLAHGGGGGGHGGGGHGGGHHGGGHHGGGHRGGGHYGGGHHATHSNGNRGGSAARGTGGTRHATGRIAGTGAFAHRHTFVRRNFANGIGIWNPFAFLYGYGWYGYANNGGYANYGGYATTTTVAATAYTGTTAFDYALLGDRAFKANRYDEAIHNWQHALLDDPSNAGLVMLLGQAYFAKGSYDVAAGAVQHGMQMIPQDQWGVVVQNYRELYSHNQAYTDQLRALERARNEKPDSPALRFLLGYHYGYLGYPKQAVHELDLAVKLNPEDKLASQLRDLMQSKLSPAATPTSVPTSS
ncbi:MAG TPA: tetratricopeptide repeat protein [Pirellulales bacterium]|nr:tetratricopeptide repeat protein [Pirellulales bacterium]